MGCLQVRLLQVLYYRCHSKDSSLVVQMILTKQVVLLFLENQESKPSVPRVYALVKPLSSTALPNLLSPICKVQKGAWSKLCSSAQLCLEIADMA